MKRIFAVAFAAALMFTFFACGTADISIGTPAASTVVLTGTLTGLEGRGLAVSVNGQIAPLVRNGTVTLTTNLAVGTAYSVTVQNQPTSPTQTCTVSNGSGTVTEAGASVSIACVTAGFKVSVSVTGLRGAGLVLQSNAGDDLAVSADGTVAFATNVASGKPYAVSVKTQPTGPVQTCVVSGATGVMGAADVSSVVVNCDASRFTIGGQISGIVGFTYACMEDNGVSKSAAAPLGTQLLCSTDANCPATHRTTTDQNGMADCTSGGRRSICPCQ